MAISTYSELKDSITDWMARSDVAGSAADFITLAEAQLNRKLDMVETDTTLTGTSDSRSIDISSLNVIEAISLYQNDSTEERRILIKPDGSFPYSTISGYPSFVALDGDKLDFDRPLSGAYTFRFRYRGRFALSDASPTNKLLTDHPDVYLAASIVWGSVYTNDVPRITGFKSLLNEFMAETSNHLTQAKRGTLSMPAGLLQSNVNRRYGNGDL